MPKNLNNLYWKLNSSDELLRSYMLNTHHTWLVSSLIIYKQICIKYLALYELGIMKKKKDISPYLQKIITQVEPQDNSARQ